MQEQQQHQMGYGGLARFKSAPASWFETLLEEAEIPAAAASTHYVSPLPPLSPSPSSSSILSNRNPALSVNNYTTSSINSFARHNSSPPELLANLCSNLDSEDGLSASSYDVLSSLLDIPTTTATRMTRGDSGSTHHLKRELSGDFLDMDMDMDMEKLFEDSVPCRVRAKRGCATHPRSIAERVRRTKISDRIRKLQELVPNMDKQTNTADMLEEAVEYVKFLQNQIQELNEHQKSCKCLGTE